MVTIEQARERYIGTVIHGKKVVDVVAKYESSPGNYSWILRCVCPYCGNLFDKKYRTLHSQPKANCGCRGSRQGVAWRKYEGGKKSDKAKPKRSIYKPTLSRKPATVQLTRNRLLTVWEELPKEKCCTAWLDFVSFYNWSILNGYAREKTLEHLLPEKPLSPLSCKWIEK